MALGAAQIGTYRDREWKQAYGYMNSCNLTGITVTQKTIAGVMVRIRGEAGNSLDSLHGTSIETAITDIVAAHHALPTLDFYLTSSQNVPNVAMKTYTAGAPAPIIFLGPKMWTKNPALPGTGAAVTGGIGSSGPRGVANQAYDGTARFFGNPKQKAQGATIVIHELGHILHEIHNPGVFWEEQQAIEGQNPSPNAPGWSGQATNVSHYASNNQLEFVAEVFTGQMIGCNYAGAVTAAYTALGGP